MASPLYWSHFHVPGPIVGALLVESVERKYFLAILGMFSFGLAFPSIYNLSHLSELAANLAQIKRMAQQC
jgi:hypothetical protein